MATKVNINGVEMIHTISDNVGHHYVIQDCIVHVPNYFGPDTPTHVIIGHVVRNHANGFFNFTSADGKVKIPVITQFSLPYAIKNV